MQEKTNIVAEHSAHLGMNIHRRKSKFLKVNSTSTVSVTLGVEAIEEVDHFTYDTYPGSVVDTQRGTEADVKARIAKARLAFLQLKNIWNCIVLLLKHKIRIFNANVKAAFTDQKHVGQHLSQ